MPPSPLLSVLIEACQEVISSNVDLLCSLDRAIGDGDHGTNMQRGMQALADNGAELAQLPFWQACEASGTILVSSIGGAAGPLYATLMMQLGRTMKQGGDRSAFSLALSQSVVAVGKRGRSQAGDKTLLDVLTAIRDEVNAGSPPMVVAARADAAAQATKDMLARCGRASWLGDRSIGHVDPGAQSCVLLTRAICQCLEGMQTK